MRSCHSVYSTWWSSLKANSQLITIKTKTILVAIMKMPLNEKIIKISMSISICLVLTIISVIWKKATKMVGCWINLELTTKPMLTFWVGEAELIELATLQISHASH